MLFYSTIENRTLELLKQLQKLPVLRDTFLAGGTALALQLGHRKSIDLDLFGQVNDDTFQISRELNSIDQVTVLKDSLNIHIYVVDGIKVDIVNYPYLWLTNPVCEEGLRLAGVEDICAMKLAAVTGRGTKKDFIDIYFLLKYFSLNEMRRLYEQKYPDGSWFLVVKSLVYFEDAEPEPLPFMLKPIDWEELKDTIRRFVC